MVILLLLISAFFGYLAVDAYIMGKPAHNVTYEIEANTRSEKLGWISLDEQRKRQTWQVVGCVGDFRLESLRGVHDCFRQRGVVGEFG